MHFALLFRVVCTSFPAGRLILFCLRSSAAIHRFFAALCPACLLPLHYLPYLCFSAVFHSLSFMLFCILFLPAEAFAYAGLLPTFRRCTHIRVPSILPYVCTPLPWLGVQACPFMCLPSRADFFRSPLSLASSLMAHSVLVYSILFRTLYKWQLVLPYVAFLSFASFFCPLCRFHPPFICPLLHFLLAARLSITLPRFLYPSARFFLSSFSLVSRVSPRPLKLFALRSSFVSFGRRSSVPLALASPCFRVSGLSHPPSAFSPSPYLRTPLFFFPLVVPLTFAHLPPPLCTLRPGPRLRVLHVTWSSYSCLCAPSHFLHLISFYASHRTSSFSLSAVCRIAVTALTSSHLCTSVPFSSPRPLLPGTVLF